MSMIGLNTGKKGTKLLSQVNTYILMQVGQYVIQGKAIRYGYSVMTTFTMMVTKQSVALRSLLALVTLKAYVFELENPGLADAVDASMLS